MSDEFLHEAIFASAGSGKTFKLAHRVIRLLALEVDPSTIIALTFTRKAAGEMFDSVVQYLIAAARDESSAQATAALIEVPGLGPADFRSLLRVFLTQLHEVQMGTLDSFMAKVLRCFPLEFGLPPDFRLGGGEELEGQQLKRTVLQGAIEQTSDFRSTFFEFTQQQALKSAEKPLLREFAKTQDIIRNIPRPEAWGNPDKLWPEGCPWDPSEDLETDLKIVTTWCEREINAYLEQKKKRPANLMESIQKGAINLAEVANNPRTRLTDRSWFTYLPLFTPAAGMGITFHKIEYEIPNTIAEALQRLYHSAGLKKALSACTRCNAMGQLGRRTLTQYALVCRAMGWMAFDDVTAFLSPNSPLRPPETQGPLSQNPGPDRLQIDYRLDARWDHWLIDEFQDTNDLQWSVLHNLIDEVVQDPSGRRSFFYVGDIKQAIYGFRGGNATLFQEVLDYYSTKITTTQLSESYRSCPAIMDTVNATFTTLPHFENRPIAEETKAGWTWEPHISEPRRRAGEAGCVQLLEVDPETDTDDASAATQATIACLQDLAPHEHGLSVGVLTLRNNTAEELFAATLKACPELPVSLAGQPNLLESPLNETLVSLLQVVQHPSDSFAWQHLRLGPMHAWLQQEEIEYPGMLATRLLQAIYRDGLFATLLDYATHILPETDRSTWEQQQLEHLLESVRMLDEEGERDLDQVIAKLRTTSIPGLESKAAVQFMTIHKSKGLGFDVVILPEMDGECMLQVSSQGSNNPWRDASSESVFVFPGSPFTTQDPGFARGHHKRNAENALGKLCQLYVAMTRAKRGMIMLVNPPPKSSASVSFARFVRAQLESDPKPVLVAGLPLSQLYSTGDPDWYRELKPEAEPEPRPSVSLPADFTQRASTRPQQKRIEPSAQEAKARPAGALFRSGSFERRNIGSATHELFEQLSFLDDQDPQALLSMWAATTTYEPHIIQEASTQFLHALTQPAIHELFTRKDPDVKLWREQRFDIQLKEGWISGMVDRAHLYHNDDGQVSRIEILDFKTGPIAADAVDEASESYRRQMELYRRALAEMFQLSESAVRLQLVWTQPGCIHEFALASTQS